MKDQIFKKIIVTLDTNILISASFWHGPSWKVLEEVYKGKCIHKSSWEILQEYKKVLFSEELIKKKKKRNITNLRAFFMILESTQIVFPKKELFLVKEDPDDNKILECALEGEVDYVITYDNHLRRIRTLGDINILTPEEFLEVLRINEEKFK